MKRKIMIVSVILCAATLLCACARDLPAAGTSQLNIYCDGGTASHSGSTGAYHESAGEETPESVYLPENIYCDRFMSYDEMMRLPTVVTSDCDREIIESLDGYVADFINRTGRKCAFVSGVCESYAHYMCADENGNIGGYTLSEVKIVDFAGAYNGFEINIGDTVTVRQDYYVRPDDDEAMLDFLTENGIVVSDKNGVSTVPGKYGEFTPYAGGDYEKCVGWYEVPMNPGEEYTFEICETESEAGIYGAFLIYPVTDEFYPTAAESLLIKNDFYDIRPDEDILAASRELCGLVKYAREK